MITDNILINISDIELAQEFCNNIDNPEIRSRSAANVLGAKIAKEILCNQSINIDVDIESGLCNIARVLKDIDISDIYINGSFVDVRLFVDGEPLTVPVDLINKLTPSVFMFIKVDSDIHSCNLAGFITSEMIEKQDSSSGLYIIQETDLLPFNDIESLLINNDKNNTIDDIQIYNYLDNTIEDKYSFYSQLVESKSSRIKFKKYVDAHDILNFVSNTYINSKDNSYTIIPDTDTDSDNIIQQSINQGQESIFNDLLEEEEEEENIIDTTLSLLKEPDSQDNYNKDIPEEYSTNTFTNVTSDIIFDDGNVQSDQTSQDESIEELFSEERLDDNSEFEQKTGTNSFRIILASIIALLVAAMAYFGFSKLNSTQKNDFQKAGNINNEITSDVYGTQNNAATNTDAMPLESVEINTSQESKEVGNPVNIPAIEKNLDSTVIVSNLKVDWEVPPGYASNASAKRYLIKLGKVIQHNLKAELLLLNKPPITSNVAVEIKFNNIRGQFETVGITTSSGERNVDNIILNTIKNALKMKLNSNISNFTKLQGNPILVIHF